MMSEYEDSMPKYEEMFKIDNNQTIDLDEIELRLTVAVKNDIRSLIALARKLLFENGKLQEEILNLQEHIEGLENDR